IDARSAVTLLSPKLQAINSDYTKKIYYTSLNALTSSLLQQRRFNDALAIDDELIQGLESLATAPGHPDLTFLVAEVYSNHAGVLSALNRKNDALPFSTKALAEFGKIQGDGGVSLEATKAGALITHGTILCELKRNSDGMDSYNKAIEILCDLVD